MTNIILNAKKSIGRLTRLSNLPFENYLLGCGNMDEYKAIIADIRKQACIDSDMTIYRLRKGTYRPNALTRREIAKVFAKHFGDKTITGEVLFPAEFYIKKH